MPSPLKSKENCFFSYVFPTVNVKVYGLTLASLNVTTICPLSFKAAVIEELISVIVSLVTAPPKLSFNDADSAVFDSIEVPSLSLNVIVGSENIFSAPVTVTTVPFIVRLKSLFSQTFVSSSCTPSETTVIFLIYVLFLISKYT